MKEIQLTQGQVALVDDEDYEELAQFKWCAQWFEHTQTYYAVRSVAGQPQGPKRVRLQMHRVVMKAGKGMIVDHRFHETLNNQKYNLRICTAAQNNHNRSIASNNTTGCKGVSRVPGSLKNKYIAHLMVNGCRMHLGTFSSFAEAVVARRNAEKEHHGEFAYEELKVA
jgi:hypothetical protein